MKFNKVKALSSILVLGITGTVGMAAGTGLSSQYVSNVKAEDNALTFGGHVVKDANYYDYLSAYTDMSVNSLKTLEAKEGNLLNYFGIDLQVDKVTPEIVNEVRNTEVINNGSSNGSKNTGKMSDNQWSVMKSNAKKGDILVSKDQSTLWVNHGHAALVYSDGSLTVEHTGEGKSNVYNITRWKDRETMRIYYPSGTSTTTRGNAANYAYNKLRGWEYGALAKCDNSKKLNCATLVWKAYKSIGVTLQKTSGGSCRPKCFVEGSAKTVYKTNANWGGGAHTW